MTWEESGMWARAELAESVSKLAKEPFKSAWKEEARKRWEELEAYRAAEAS